MVKKLTTKPRVCAKKPTPAATSTKVPRAEEAPDYPKDHEEQMVWWMRAFGGPRVFLPALLRIFWGARNEFTLPSVIRKYLDTDIHMNNAGSIELWDKHQDLVLGCVKAYVKKNKVSMAWCSSYSIGVLKAAAREWAQGEVK